MNPNVVTRFAPSPTGHLHGGNYRTAVFAYLFARKNKGAFIVRIEDTDRERSTKEYENAIWESLEWLKLTPDKKFRQSEQAGRHQELLQKLIIEGKAYISKEEPAQEGGRSEVIRFKNPNTSITFRDLIRGPITIDTTDLGNFVVARSLSEPVFHFAVVVDDADEGVTHVIRGEDHISNTPRQILIGEALGFTTPIYAHLPLVLGSDRTKLSKRRGAKALTQYRDEGYTPEAVINYLALLGWHPADERELFTLEELVEAFTLERIQKSAGIFDEEKLLWFNHEHFKLLTDTEFATRFSGYLRMQGSEVPPYLQKITSLLKERYRTFGEALEAIKEGGEFSFLEETISYGQALLLQSAKAEASVVGEHLKKVLELLRPLSENNFGAEKIKEVIFPYATEVGRSAVLWPMRVALSGKERSPDPFVLASLLGREKTAARIEQALAVLK